MRRWHLLFAALLTCTALNGCADDTPAPTAPPAQNITYNTTFNYADTTNVGTAPAPSTIASLPAQTGVVAPSVIEPQLRTNDGTTRDLASTGVASCDAYLARIESCSGQLLSRTNDSGKALGRITASLDMTRRAWRDAARTPASAESLVQTCADALRIYNSSVEEYCPR